MRNVPRTYSTMDVEGVSTPAPFHPRPGKPATPWKDWKFSFENYFAAIDGDKFSDQRQRALLLHCVGAEAQRIFKSLPTTPKLEDETEYKHTLRQLSGFYEPKVNVIAERYAFRQRRQSPSETTAEYVAALRGLTANCQFGSLTGELIRDQVVEWTVHPRL